LPGIVDQVITMAEVKGDGADGQEVKPWRALICHTINPYNYPAKDRSGRLDWLEQPHLGKLMDKIRKKAEPVNERLTYTCPQPIDTSAVEGE
jgi:hypothetical protein